MNENQVCLQKAPTIGILITFGDKTDVFLYGDDVDELWKFVGPDIQKKYNDSGCCVIFDKPSHEAWVLDSYKLIAEPIDLDFYDRNGLMF